MDVDLRCPVPGCEADLYLEISSSTPLYRQDPPWPGAGLSDYSGESAVVSSWVIRCVDGHTVWTHVDQIRANNAAGITDDDETGDYAPEFEIGLFSRVWQLG